MSACHVLVLLGAALVAGNLNGGDARSPGRAGGGEQIRFSPVEEMMDAEGAALGRRLSNLKGAEFEAAYLEHARHIVQAQERARQRDLHASHSQLPVAGR